MSKIHRSWWRRNEKLRTKRLCDGIDDKYFGHITIDETKVTCKHCERIIIRVMANYL